METPESIRTFLIPGEWVSLIDLSDTYLHIPIISTFRFCHGSQVFQFTFMPFGLATVPQVFTMIIKEVQLMALSRGLTLQQYLDDWLIMSQSWDKSLVNTQAVVDLTQSLGWIINQEKSDLNPTQVFLFVGYEYHIDSALVKPTQERWLKLQDFELRSKHVLTARCLMSLIWLLASMEKMVPPICQKWFTPHMDLFATHLNHKLPLYVSPIPDPKAWDIDAINVDSFTGSHVDIESATDNLFTSPPHPQLLPFSSLSIKTPA